MYCSLIELLLQTSKQNCNFQTLYENNIRETKFSTNRNLDTVVYSNEIETLIR